MQIPQEIKPSLAVSRFWDAPFHRAGAPTGSALPCGVGIPSLGSVQSAQTEARMSLELLAGGGAKGGEDLRAWIPPVVHWGCDL